MKAVLLSIRPEWCKFIWAGMKTVEVRKTRPTLETPFKAYIYCTGHDGWVIKSPKAGVQKMDSRVIGEFVCDKIDRLTHIGAMGSNEPAKLYIETPDFEYEYAGELFQAACLSETAAEGYLKGGDGYGWHISELKIYDQPRKLRAFTGLQSTRFGMRPVEITRPPQSWRYVEELSNE